jgi:PleD family two-component response regulator
VAAWQEGKTAQDLVAMADAALYKAKSRGKNQAISS